MSKFFAKDVPLDKKEFKNGNDQFHLKSIGDVITKLLRDQKNNNHHGSSIALIGSWGTGKSTLLKYIQGELIDSHRFIFVNAWPYDEESLKSVLLREVYYEISRDERNESQEFYEALKSITAKMTGEEKLSIEKLKELIVKIIPFVAVSFIFCLIYVLLVSFFGDNTFKEVLYKDVAAIYATMFLGSGGIWAFFSYMKQKNDTNIHVSLPVESSDYYEHKLKGYINQSHNGGNDKRFVVIIDDLDRLSFESMIQSIETVKVFMDIPQLDVILPFDERIVKNALKETKLKKLYMQEYNLAKYEGFLDKLFQYKFYLPPIKIGHIKEYALNLIKNLEGIVNIHRQYGVDITDIISVLIYSKVETPRQVKKLINAYSSNLQISLDRVKCNDLQLKLGVDEFKVIAFLSTLHSEFGYFYESLVDGSITLNSTGDLISYISYSDGKLNAYTKVNDSKNDTIKLNEKGITLDNYLSFNSNLKLDLINVFLFMADNIIVKKYGVKANDLKQALINKNIKADIINVFKNDKAFTEKKYDSFLVDIVDEAKGQGDRESVNNIIYSAIMLSEYFSINKTCKAFQRMELGIDLELLNEYEINNLSVNAINYFLGSDKINIFNRIADIRYNILNNKIESNEIEGNDFIDETDKLIEIHKALLDEGIIDKTTELIKIYNADDELDDEKRMAISRALYQIMSKSEYIEKCEFEYFDDCILDNAYNLDEIKRGISLLVRTPYPVTVRVIEKVIGMKLDNKEQIILSNEIINIILENLFLGSIKEKNNYVRSFNKLYEWLSLNQLNKNLLFKTYGEMNIHIGENEYENPGKNIIDFREKIINIAMDIDFMKDTDAIEFFKKVLSNNKEITGFFDYIVKELIDNLALSHCVDVLELIHENIIDIKNLLNATINQINRYFVYSNATSGKYNEYKYITSMLEKAGLVKVTNLITNQGNFDQGIRNFEKISEMLMLSMDYVCLDGYEKIIDFWTTNTQKILSNHNEKTYLKLLELRFEINNIDNALIASFSSRIKDYYQDKGLVSKILYVLFNDENNRNQDLIKILKYITLNETEARELFGEISKYSELSKLILGLSQEEVKKGIDSISTSKLNKIVEMLIEQYSTNKINEYIEIMYRNQEIARVELVQFLFSDVIKEYSKNDENVNFENMYKFFSVSVNKKIGSTKIKDDMFWEVIANRLDKDDYRELINIIKLVKISGLDKNKQLINMIKNSIYLVTENDELKNSIIEELNIKIK
jgi:energy-coupling factor transporter ATP-binding protein EcfA2